MKLADTKGPQRLPVAKLVDCLVKLGGIAEAQLILRRHMPTQVAPPCNVSVLGVLWLLVICHVK